MPRLGNGWKQLADAHARAYWHFADYRYFDSRDAAPRRIAELAASATRDQLSSAYREATQHPKSHKALDNIRQSTRTLVRIGRYLLATAS